MFFYVYMIFCLWFFCLLFFVCFPRFVLISIRKTTITYIQYFDVSFVFVLQFFFCCISIYFTRGPCVQWTPATSRYKFWDMDFASAALSSIRLGVMFIGSTKIVSHFLRNFFFVERDAFICTLHQRSGAFDFSTATALCHVSFAIDRPCTRTDTQQGCANEHDAVAWSRKQSRRRPMAEGRNDRNYPVVKVYANKWLSLVYFCFLFYFFFAWKI